MIISASRRTDIPAFYGEWMVNRLKAGEVYVRNPMNTNQLSFISLKPKDVDCIVFWTKDPRDLLYRLPEIDAMGYSYYFLFSLTSYDTNIERRIPRKREIINRFRELSEIIGKERVVWRYDPIIISDKFDREYHKKWFGYLVEEVVGYTEKCIISFLDIYKKTERNMKDILYKEFDNSLMQEYGRLFSNAVAGKGISLCTCAEKIDLSEWGIEDSKCIDDTLIEKLFHKKLKKRKDPGQREECGCVVSRDIGLYNTCQHGCKYCYATSSDKEVEKNLLKYDSQSPCLCGSIGNEKIIQVESKSPVQREVEKEFFQQ